MIYKSLGGSLMWWCPTCDKILTSYEVTYQEDHDERYGGCGDGVEWVSDIRKLRHLLGKYPLEADIYKDSMFWIVYRDDTKRAFVVMENPRFDVLAWYDRRRKLGYYRHPATEVIKEYRKEGNWLGVVKEIEDYFASHRDRRFSSG